MSVLVLQGAGAARDQVIASLEAHGFSPVRTVSRIADLAAVLAEFGSASAILVDLALDEELNACQQIRAADATVPLLVLFDDDSAVHLEQALAVGASGCVPQPLNPLELAAKLRAAIRQRRCIQPFEREDVPADSDPLTKLATDQTFRRHLDRLWRRDWRSRTPVSLIVCNIDDFAHFNQVYGHAAGDDCLGRIAAAIQQALYRPGDLAAHRGSGEFAVLLSGADLAGASVVAERLRDRVLELAIPHEGSSAGSHVSISLGIATAIPSPEALLDELVSTAERALSQAKLRGRNQFVTLDAEPAAWLA